ncbi:uncharacterized protein LOC143462879 [Clavelina lepadiformis]|uniref:uncharacterized protein LOC143462879 n=1 Tax=Clavelina lepadiformis TaxID=159417 RepID=UPI0040421345
MYSSAVSMDASTRVDLSSLSNISLDDSDAEEDQYVEQSTIDEDEYDNISDSEDVIVDSDDDEVVVIPSLHEGSYTNEDFSWRTGYTTRWKHLGNATNSSSLMELNVDRLHQRSKSEANLSEITFPKKRLSVDLKTIDAEPPSTGRASSFFRTIGNWFRASNRSVRSNPTYTTQKENVVVERQEEPKSILKPVTMSVNSKVEVGTSFSSFIYNNLEPAAVPKKVIRFSGSKDPDDTSDLDSSEDSLDESDFSDEDESEGSSTESSLSATKHRTASLDEHDGGHVGKGPPCNFSVPYNATYQLRSSNQSQCLAWQRYFRKCPGIEISCKNLNEDLVADAIIIPGNSFGFLDGEPEIQYVKLLGWEIQKRLRHIICQEHDGELLVGEAVIFPMPTTERSSSGSSSSEESGHDEEKSDSDAQKPRRPTLILPDNEEERVYCKTIKNIVYVPVMRVPTIVQDTVNAYLAFRAAIRTIKSHNSTCDEESKIRRIICPAFCSGIGRMPPTRIALQMKNAYDAFVLHKRHDLRMPVDLGTLASCHVQMTSAKSGSWC